MGLLRRLFGPRTFSMSKADKQMWATTWVNGIQNSCNCFAMAGDHTKIQRRPVLFHAEEQNTSSAAWTMLETLIDEAASREETEFAPGLKMPPELWQEIVTLPPSIAKLTHVKKFYLYGSYLVRIPPEIGAMSALEELDLYASYRLHWLPFEVTRCPKLKRSRVSTRALYGNYKYRPPFPDLNDATKLTTRSPCSVCARPFDPAAVRQVWITIRVATDVLPLLVNACSDECIARLPKPAFGYVDHPHKGGLEIAQPDPTFIPPR
jgi:hypothetical protein